MEEQHGIAGWKRQLLHMVAGMLVLVLPFVPTQLLLIGCGLVLVVLALVKYVHRVPISSDDLGSGMMLVLAALVLVAFVLLSEMAYSHYPSMMSGALPLFVVGAALSIATIADSIANIYQHTRQGTGAEPKLRDVSSSLVFLFSSMVVALVIGGWIALQEGMMVSLDVLFFVSVMGAISATLLGSISPRTTYNLVVPMGSAMVMWLFFDVGYTTPILHVLGVLVGALVLGYLAYRVGIADLSGLLSATLVGVLVMVFGSVWWFVLVLSFFVLGGGFTKYRYAYKESLGAAQSRRGVRGYENVFSNTLPALALVVLYRVFPELHPVIFAAFLASIATATADTLASEVGETSRAVPRLITNLKPVRVGEDGGITLLGEAASLMGALATALLAFVLLELGLEPMPTEPSHMLVVGVISGFAGTNIDSLLGATLQRRGVLGNSGVNLASTAMAAILGAAMYNYL
ncbi:DUF92 domain-containing protein [Methermicoccus shengliensis]|uniref:DUF92 domain-containing protein n=1 Tax=Methermicoccus shengliensis TaxID=660064 RepID=A0A832VX01_9EURY|nr:DUF92 domain-containing protein [Methermicoccus shengliensis]KUK05156.1 MAG: TIGR00297 family protein [Euryarchaeota archaeon 55_53]KUK30722.1 MAG: TIGR00297 family protein [Methanosarcinales archeaon 56_1174]MDI3487316.1 hypothetical protein [Methanosarcinales archaeon]MDN5294610.1 hypothetical protein [Methanosarcinales archaeon]HIH69318.1 DUF92 domain-containing protein [Methermicoccus shengliensis]